MSYFNLTLVKDKIWFHILSLIFISFFIRLIFLQFSDITHADAVSRILISEEWLLNIKFIYKGYWLPFHFYLNALFIWIINDRVFGPILLHIIIASLSAWPVYLWIKSVKKEAAFITAMFYVLNPLTIHNSLQPLAEVNHAFFLLWGLYFFTRAIQVKAQIKYTFFAAIFFLLASGFRYESWAIIFILSVVLLITNNVKSALIFALISSLFAFVWMTGNYIGHKDFFYGINVAYNYNDSFGINEKILGTVVTQRWLFSLYSLFYNIGLPLSIVLFAIIFMNIKKINRNHLVWVILFLLMLLLIVKKNVDGSLILQHRFTITLLVLFLPIFSFVFSKGSLIQKKFIFIFICLNVLWSIKAYEYNWFKHHKGGGVLKAIKFLHVESSRETSTFPKLKDDYIKDFSIEINKYLDASKGLILDKFGWENTFYLKLYSRLLSSNIYNVPITSGYLTEVKYIHNLIDKHPEGAIVIKDSSQLFNIFQMRENYLEYSYRNEIHRLSVKEVYRAKNISIYIYNKFKNQHGIR